MAALRCLSLRSRVGESDAPDAQGFRPLLRTEMEPYAAKQSSGKSTCTISITSPTRPIRAIKIGLEELCPDYRHET